MYYIGDVILRCYNVVINLIAYDFMFYLFGRKEDKVILMVIKNDDNYI